MTVFRVFLLLTMLSGVQGQTDTVNVFELLHLTSLPAINNLKGGLNGLPPAATDTTQSTTCTYDDVITCDPSQKFRQIDGTCNNLARPILGSSKTPFERFMAPQYEDGIGSLRVTGLGSGSVLPEPRTISVNFHEKSKPENLQDFVKHACMEFGQFLSHDANENEISRSPAGCCNFDGTVNTDPVSSINCAAITVAPTDPFFSVNGGRLCLVFARAAEDTDIRCNSNLRQQTNDVTSYLDLSLVYGSDQATADSIRSTDGLLEGVGPVGEELMKQSPALNNFGCRSPVGSTNFCFISGDSRTNQNPMLITMHTVFFREHNRVARALKLMNSGWDDERLYQEARRIVIAEYQHITYKEYLPTILSVPVSVFAGIYPRFFGYFNGYDSSVNPSIRNEFMTAAYRSGHSNIDSIMGPNLFLKDHFFNPALIYDPTKGVDFLTEQMVQNQQQTMDRFKTDQVTNHLFQFSDGNGNDLASVNIQRGRDHGLPSYNDMRVFCGLPRATSFDATSGGLEHHTSDAAGKLATLYSDVDDIEAWTGMSSEKRLFSGVFGPTAACLTAIQFRYLKYGDRFYYETNDPVTRFTTAQLNQIRRASLSRIFCDNTGIQNIQRRAFWNEAFWNPSRDCTSLPEVNLSAWQE